MFLIINLKRFFLSPNKNKLSSTQNKIIMYFKMYENSLYQLLTSNKCFGVLFSKHYKSNQHRQFSSLKRFYFFPTNNKNTTYIKNNLVVPFVSFNFVLRWQNVRFNLKEKRKINLRLGQFSYVMLCYVRLCQVRLFMIGQVRRLCQARLGGQIRLGPF